MNQLGRLDLLEFLGAYWLSVILSNHFNREPCCNNEIGVDLSFPESCPVHSCSFVSILTPQTEGLFMRSSSLIQAVDSFHGVPHPEFLSIDPQPGECGSSVGIEYLR